MTALKPEETKNSSADKENTGCGRGKVPHPVFSLFGMWCIIMKSPKMEGVP